MSICDGLFSALPTRHMNRDTVLTSIEDTSRYTNAAVVQKQSNEPLVFLVRRDTKCDECGGELCKGEFVVLEGERGALGCAHKSWSTQLRDSSWVFQ